MKFYRMSGREQAVHQAMRAVEQLQGERNMQRISVSLSSADLIRFTQDLQREDVLLSGFPNDKMNPYRPKSSFQCNLI
ncbi:GGL domain protein [Dictyocaulus viviparus]|uniref:GGL domain protein n=1 Tax=Dictyocaulus viviparus TaxID=29172 RepID=A0A0D8XEJ6_DICVI|nr:GGL domain protein [Dictyocaulus viviparus]